MPRAKIRPLSFAVQLTLYSIEENQTLQLTVFIKQNYTEFIRIREQSIQGER